MDSSSIDRRGFFKAAGAAAAGIALADMLSGSEARAAGLPVGDFSRTPGTRTRPSPASTRPIP